MQEWQQQFDKLESVDLRYDRQIIVNPDLQGTAKQPPMSADAARKAMAAGVKPAALITHITALSKPSPATMAKTFGPSQMKPVTTNATPAKTVTTKSATTRKTAQMARRKANARTVKARAKGKVKAGATQTPKVSAKTGKQSASTKGKISSTSQPAAKAPTKPSPAIAKGEEPR